MILLLKIFHGEQRLQSWFLARSRPSPQVAGLPNKARFPFQPTLVSRVSAFQKQAEEPDFQH